MSPHAFLYEQCDIPAGMSADQYRRRPGRRRRGHRALRAALLRKA